MQARASQAVLHSRRPDLRLNPRLLVSTMGVTLAAAGLIWLAGRVSEPGFMPIQKIVVQGAFVHVTEQMLQPLSKDISGAGYFALDVQHIQRQVEKLPWVRQAMVRRVWPDSLVIQIVEQQPLALWRDGGIVSRQGELFSPEQAGYPVGLPVFQGPEKSQALMVEQYYSMSDVLARQELSIAKLELDERRSWRLTLGNGIVLKLGRDDPGARLQRFVRAYAQLEAMRQVQLSTVDLRYTNGMAVAWKQGEQ